MLAHFAHAHTPLKWITQPAHTVAHMFATQVFPAAGFQALYDGLRNTTQAGGPTYHLANYTVLTNNHQAIFGGWQVC